MRIFQKLMLAIPIEQRIFKNSMPKKVRFLPRNRVMNRYLLLEELWRSSEAEEEIVTVSKEDRAKVVICRDQSLI